MYIADHLNARIQSIALVDYIGVGTTVISEVYFSFHVHADDEEGTPTIYVSLSVDSQVEKRVMNAIAGEILIAGLSGQASRSDQFNEPTDLAIDSDGHLYVSDLKNHRVQRFRLRDQLCLFFFFFDTLPCFFVRSCLSVLNSRICFDLVLQVEIKFVMSKIGYTIFRER